MSPTGNDQYTFFLVRLPERKNISQDTKYLNEISIAELCSKINQNRLEEGTFVLCGPIPQYEQLSRLPTLTSIVYSFTKPIDGHALPQNSIAHEQRSTKKHAEQSNSSNMLPHPPTSAQHLYSLYQLSSPNGWFSGSREYAGYVFNNETTNYFFASEQLTRRCSQFCAMETSCSAIGQVNPELRFC